MRIAVDLDSTLSSFIDAWLKWYNEEYGTVVVPEDITNWGIHEHVPHGTAIYDFFDVPGALVNVEIEPYAHSVMSWLQHNNHDVYIVSSVVRDEHYGEKKLWVRKHLPFFDMKRFIACSSKEVVLADVMLDDGLHNLENFEGMKPVVYDRPWNRQTVYPFKRVHSWPEFLQYVEKIAPTFS